MIGPTSQCGTCVHFRSPFSQKDFGGGPFCAAFPDGIPDEIYDNLVDHRRSVDGDHGVRWEPDGDVSFPDWAKASPTARSTAVLVNAVDPRQVDLTAVQRDWEQRLDDLIANWGGITAHQRDEIVDRVRAAITANDIAALASLSVSTAEATEALKAAMTEMALSAAAGYVTEAAAQDVRVDPVASDGAVFDSVAAATAAFLAQGLANAAGREALRRWSPSTTGDDVSAAVRDYIDSLSDTFVRDQLGGALSSAQQTGRVNTMLAGPSAALYASEVLDKRSCDPCRAIDGRWIGNTDDPAIQDKIEAVYPNGNYRDCEGGVRCRGTIVAVYGARTTAV